MAALVLLAQPASAQKFATVGNLKIARFFDSAILLADGRVLIFGGSSTYPANNLVAQAELYDPKTHAFTLTGSMVWPRETGGAALLPDGKVFIAGGTCNACMPPPSGGAWADSGEASLPPPELYDPASGTFSPTPPYATVAGKLFFGEEPLALGDGRVLLTGLECEPQWMLYYCSSGIQIYDPAQNSFRDAGPVPGAQGYSDEKLLSNGDVLFLVGGAFQAASPWYANQIYNPANGSWMALPNLPTWLLWDTPIQGGRIFIVADYNAGSGDPRFPTGTAGYLFDDTTDNFSLAGMLSLPLPSGIVSLVPLPSGRVLLASAFSAVWDPANQGFAVAGAMNDPLGPSTVTALADGSVLFTGGNAGGNADSGYVPAARAEVFTEAPNEFSLAATFPSLTTSPSVAGQLTIQPANGFAGAVQLKCSVLYAPSSATACSILPSTLAVGATATIQVAGLSSPGYANFVIYGRSADGFSSWTTFATTVPAVQLTLTYPQGTALKPGQSLTVNFAVSGNGNFPISLACSTTAPAVSCSVSPASAGGTTQTQGTLTITAAASSAIPPSGDPSSTLRLSIGLLAAFLLVMGMSRLKPTPAVRVAGKAVAFAALVLLSACGAPTTSPQPAPPPAPTFQGYGVTLTASFPGGSTTQSVSITVSQ
jgi:hypothetical protein